MRYTPLESAVKRVSRGRGAGRECKYLDMLPDIRFGIDYAHVGLIGAAIDEYSVVHLQKGVLRVVLYSRSVMKI